MYDPQVHLQTDRNFIPYVFFELKPWGKAPRQLILNKEEKRSYRRELTKGPNQQLDKRKETGES
jgi:hypothetical protein